MPRRLHKTEISAWARAAPASAAPIAYSKDACSGAPDLSVRHHRHRHLAAFSALELLVPQALPPLPPLADGLGLFPRSAGAGVGLAALALFGAAAAGVAASALGDGEAPPAAEPEP